MSTTMIVLLEDVYLSSSIFPPLPMGTTRWLPSLMGGKRRIASLLVDSRSADPFDDLATPERTYMTAFKYGISAWCFVFTAVSPGG